VDTISAAIYPETHQNPNKIAKNEAQKVFLTIFMVGPPLSYPLCYAGREKILKTTKKTL
jgi:hypothetical protein